eukprot:TRINITY_DN13488_c0_g1_i1.p1 TRINITY_DN13488_c0_g1~~TRINITY_DN13488_c0_g1_i1.p1  ORF type:complete len:1760 (-),score=495.66 TRINITY_DN13488_c0_g1_i1:80-5359(-)
MSVGPADDSLTPLEQGPLAPDVDRHSPLLGGAGAGYPPGPGGAAGSSGGYPRPGLGRGSQPPPPPPPGARADSGAAASAAAPQRAPPPPAREAFEDDAPPPSQGRKSERSAGGKEKKHKKSRSRSRVIAPEEDADAEGGVEDGQRRGRKKRDKDRGRAAFSDSDEEASGARRRSMSTKKSVVPPPPPPPPPKRAFEDLGEAPGGSSASSASKPQTAAPSAAGVGVEVRSDHGHKKPAVAAPSEFAAREAGPALSAAPGAGSRRGPMGRGQPIVIPDENEAGLWGALSWGAKSALGFVSDLVSVINADTESEDDKEKKAKPDAAAAGDAQPAPSAVDSMQGARAADVTSTERVEEDTGRPRLPKLGGEEAVEPSEEEVPGLEEDDEYIDYITQFCVYLGIDAAAEPDLIMDVDEFLKRPLPEGWTSLQTAEECEYGGGYTYYVHASTGRTQWTRPDEDDFLQQLAQKATKPALAGSRLYFAAQRQKQRRARHTALEDQIGHLPDVRPLLRALPESASDTLPAWGGSKTGIIHVPLFNQFPVLTPSSVEAFAAYFGLGVCTINRSEFTIADVRQFWIAKLAALCPVPEGYEFRFDEISNAAVFVDVAANTATPHHPLDAFFAGLLERCLGRHRSTEAAESQRTGIAASIGSKAAFFQDHRRGDFYWLRYDGEGPLGSTPFQTSSFPGVQGDAKKPPARQPPPPSKAKPLKTLADTLPPLPGLGGAKAPAQSLAPPPSTSAVAAPQATAPEDELDAAQAVSAPPPPPPPPPEPHQPTQAKLIPPPPSSKPIVAPPKASTQFFQMSDSEDEAKKTTKLVELTFETRPFGMTPAKGQSELGYVVERVNESDATMPAPKFGVKPGWVLYSVNGWEVKDMLLEHIQHLCKEAALPVVLEFEVPLEGVEAAADSSTPTKKNKNTEAAQNQDRQMSATPEDHSPGAEVGAAPEANSSKPPAQVEAATSQVSPQTTPTKPAAADGDGATAAEQQMAVAPATSTPPGPLAPPGHAAAAAAVDTAAAASTEDSRQESEKASAADASSVPVPEPTSPGAAMTPPPPPPQAVAPDRSLPGGSAAVRQGSAPPPPKLPPAAGLPVLPSQGRDSGDERDQQWKREDGKWCMKGSRLSSDEGSGTDVPRNQAKMEVAAGARVGRGVRATIARLKAAATGSAGEEEEADSQPAAVPKRPPVALSQQEGQYLAELALLAERLRAVPKDDAEQLCEVLTALEKVPATVFLLRETQLGILTQPYKDHQDKAVRAVARRLRRSWKDLIQSAQTGPGDEEGEAASPPVLAAEASHSMAPPSSGDDKEEDSAEDTPSEEGAEEGMPALVPLGGASGAKTSDLLKEKLPPEREAKLSYQEGGSSSSSHVPPKSHQPSQAAQQPAPSLPGGLAGGLAIPKLGAGRGGKAPLSAEEKARRAELVMNLQWLCRLFLETREQLFATHEGRPSEDDVCNGLREELDVVRFKGYLELALGAAAGKAPPRSLVRMLRSFGRRILWCHRHNSVVMRHTHAQFLDACAGCADGKAFVKSAVPRVLQFFTRLIEDERSGSGILEQAALMAESAQAGAASPCGDEDPWGDSDRDKDIIFSEKSAAKLGSPAGLRQAGGLLGALSQPQSLAPLRLPGSEGAAKAGGGYGTGGYVGAPPHAPAKPARSAAAPVVPRCVAANAPYYSGDPATLSRVAKAPLADLDSLVGTLLPGAELATEGLLLQFSDEELVMMAYVLQQIEQAASKKLVKELEVREELRSVCMHRREYLQLLDGAYR